MCPRLLGRGVRTPSPDATLAPLLAHCCRCCCSWSRRRSLEGILGRRSLEEDLALDEVVPELVGLTDALGCASKPPVVREQGWSDGKTHSGQQFISISM
jgi:hypothetical protein